jgi:hypothetical protein
MAAFAAESHSMNHENKYRLAQEQAQRRLAELSEGDATDLRDELALCRYLLESAAQQSSPAAIALLQTAAKLSQADVQNRLRSRDLMDRDEVMRVARELCSIVSDEIQVLDGYEDVLQRVAERIGVVMARPQLEDQSHD